MISSRCHPALNFPIKRRKKKKTQNNVGNRLYKVIEQHFMGHASTHSKRIHIQTCSNIGVNKIVQKNMTILLNKYVCVNVKGFSENETVTYAQKKVSIYRVFTHGMKCFEIFFVLLWVSCIMLKLKANEREKNQQIYYPLYTTIQLQQVPFTRLYGLSFSCLRLTDRWFFFRMKWHKS